MNMIVEIVLWASLAVSSFAYGGYALIGRLLMRRERTQGRMV